jgi:hypothetical protein
MEKGSFKFVDPNKGFVVHPNVLLAYLTYRGKAEEFEEVMHQAKEGHNDEYDQYMLEIAEQRTIAQAILGWKWEGE